MKLLLEMIAERDVDEGRARRHKLHRRRQPALHERYVAGGKKAGQVRQALSRKQLTGQERGGMVGS